MAGPSAPPKPPGPRPATPPQGSGGATTSFAAGVPRSITRGMQTAAHKIVIYGSGGIGKSKLASLLSSVSIEPLFLDLESGTKFLDVARIEPQSWDEIRQALHDATLLRDFGAVVIDSGTKAEEMATAWTLTNVKHEKGTTVNSIEGYGFGKGQTHVFETFMQLLGDLDAVARSGKHVVVICHDCTANVPNPTGEDFIRWEPRLQNPASGKFSIRSRLKEFSDHMLFIGYDVAVDQTGKGTGIGSRAIYTSERPSHMAKSRTMNETIIYKDGDASLWAKLFNKEIQ